MPRTIIDTPIGTLALHSWDDRLVQIRWASGADDGGEPPSSADARDPVLADACRQLRAFFDRKLTRFDLPLAPSPSPRGDDRKSTRLNSVTNAPTGCRLLL